MVKVICALRTGGDYGREYVYNLFRTVSENTTVPFEFHVVSNDPGVATLLFRTELAGWWCKLEVFRFKGPCVYLDLDSVIVGNIDGLLRLAEKMHDRLLMQFPIRIMRGVQSRNKHASSTMVWNGDFEYILNEVTEAEMKHIHVDQRYIELKALERGIDLGYVNDYFQGIYSYKWDCKRKIPEDATVCSFHGNPRPIQVGGKFFVTGHGITKYREAVKENAIKTRVGHGT